MNIDKIIFLNWFDIQIGRLLYVDKKYVFQIVEDNLVKARDKFCPLEMLLYKQNIRGITISKDLPIVFNEFKISNERIDCYEKMGILKDDDEYTKLYKLAMHSNKVDKNGYWISTYSIS